MDKRTVQELKAKMHIAWDHEDGYLRNLLINSRAYLNQLCNTELDFKSQGLARELLLERSHYAYYNLLHEFETNYIALLTALILNTAIQKGGGGAVKPE